MHKETKIVIDAVSAFMKLHGRFYQLLPMEISLAAASMTRIAKES